MPRFILIMLIAMVSCKSNEKLSDLQNSGQVIDYKEVSPAVQLNFAGGVRCSGTVIGISSVITAAHCIASIDSSETQVTVLYRDSEKEPFISRVFLVEDLTSKTDLVSVVGAAKAYFLKKSTKHDGFSANEYPINKSSGGHDLAIIEFDKRVFHHTGTIAIATLPPDDRSILQSVGFGLSSNFQPGTGDKSLAHIRNSNFCDGYYLSFAKVGKSDFVTNGDSGAPLVFVKGNKSWTAKDSEPSLVGVVSSGFFGLFGGKWGALPPRKRGGEIDFEQIETYVSIFTSLYSDKAIKLLLRAAASGVKLHAETIPSQLKPYEPPCKSLPWGSYFSKE